MFRSPNRKERKGETLFTPPPGHDDVYPGRYGTVRIRTGFRDFDDGYLKRADQMSLKALRRKEPCACHVRSPHTQPIIKDFPQVSGMLLQGAETPSHQKHLVIRPVGPNCPSEHFVRTMGGRKSLKPVLDGMVLPLIDRYSAEHLRLVYYAGRQRGMNNACYVLGNLVNVEDGYKSMLAHQSTRINRLKKSKLVVASSGNTSIVVESIYCAGQCWGFSTEDEPLNTGDLTEVIIRTIERFSKAFRSTRNMPPDFNLLVDIWQGKLNWLCFTPHLAPVGVEQAAMVFMPGVTEPQQWTKERTMQRLNEFS